MVMRQNTAGLPVGMNGTFARDSMGLPVGTVRSHELFRGILIWEVPSDIPWYLILLHT